VVTYDPRGFGRSQRTDSAKGSTPDEHADDLHRLITALGAGRVDIFGSSGGAVNDDPMVGQHIVSTTHYEQEFDALRAASTRIVIGAGSESEGRDDLPRSGGLGRAARDRSRHLPQSPRRVPWRRIRACRATLTRSPATLRQVLTEHG
jgi:pimeloyl-ACP methyl ester carboxylesterase